MIAAIPTEVAVAPVCVSCATCAAFSLPLALRLALLCCCWPLQPALFVVLRQWPKLSWLVCYNKLIPVLKTVVYVLQKAKAGGGT
jgi:hypothetical protein